MALGGIVAGLVTTVPSVTSQAGLGYADLQSIKTTFQQVLDSEHILPSTGGSGSGAHRKGSAVAFYGASSALSSSDTDGRLFINSTTSRLHHAGSTNTQLFGSQYLIESASVMKNLTSTFTSGITQMWGAEAGIAIMGKNSTTTLVTLQNTYTLAAMAVATPVQYTAFATTIGGIPTASVAGNVLSLSNYQFSSAGTGSLASSTVTYGVNYVVMGIKVL